jgi:hypothetical protein
MLNTPGFANPRAHPDNANLPNINRPETIMGVTLAFLVCCRIAYTFKHYAH